MQHRQESAARQGMGLFLWPRVLGQQDSRGILTSSALRIKLREYLCFAGHLLRKLHVHKHLKMHIKPSSPAMRKTLNQSTHKYSCLQLHVLCLCA